MRTIEWGLLKEVIEHYKVYDAKTIITWNSLNLKRGIFKCRPLLTIKRLAMLTLKCIQTGWINKQKSRQWGSKVTPVIDDFLPFSIINIQ